MRERKYYIAFDGYERGDMVNALNEIRIFAVLFIYITIVSN